MHALACLLALLTLAVGLPAAAAGAPPATAAAAAQQQPGTAHAAVPQQPGTADAVPADATPAAAAFTRGDALPRWALPLAELPPASGTEPVLLRVAETQIHLGAAGSGAAYLVNRALQVNDAGALSQIGQYPLYFVPQYQRIRLHRLTLWRGGRPLDRLADANVRFLEREGGLESGMYSGMVTAVLLLDDVRVGDTLQLVYTLEGQNPVFDGRYSHQLAWDQGEPVALRRATLIAPAERRVAWRLLGDAGVSMLTPRELSAAGAPERVLRFEERGIPALDDEPAVPEDYYAGRVLQLTEFADWAAVARWAAPLFPADAELPPELAPLLQRWRALPEPEQRAREALRWVQEEIRYFSVSTGESSHRPHAPAWVVQRRFGDCKDKTLLLVTLLRALGIEARPLLVSLSAPRTPARLLPTPDAFDHVIAQARIDGVDYYLDGTRLGQRGALATLGTLEGAYGLPVPAPGDGVPTALVRVSTPDPVALATQELDERFVVEQLGGAGRLQVQRRWRGTAAELLRLQLARLSPEQRRKRALAPYERRYTGIALAGEPRWIDDGQANTMTLQAEFSVPQLTRETPEGWVLRYQPDNLAGTVRLPEDFQRRYPASVAAVPSQARYHLRVQWPEALRLGSPDDAAHWTTPFFQAELLKQAQANVMQLDLQFVPTAAQATPAELPQLAEAVRGLERRLGAALLAPRGAVTRDGVLGLGRRSEREVQAARIARVVTQATQAISGGQLEGEDLAEALCARAEAQAEGGRVAAGLADAEQALAAAPGHARAHECRARLLLAAQRYDDAAADYTLALSLGREAASVLYWRGIARYCSGRYDGAADDFAKVVALHARGAPHREDTQARQWQLQALQRAGRSLPAGATVAGAADTGCSVSAVSVQ